MSSYSYHSFSWLKLKDLLQNLYILNFSTNKLVQAEIGSLHRTYSKLLLKSNTHCISKYRS